MKYEKQNKDLKTEWENEEWTRIGKMNIKHFQ